MASLKAIRRRIVSVQNTKQITRAMKLVSAAKLRRAQDAAVNAQTFAGSYRELLTSVLADLPAGASHPLLVKRPVKTRRLVVISGDRGLCGAFNANVYKAVINGETEEQTALELIALGRKTAANAKHIENAALLTAYEGLPEDVSLWPADSIASDLIESYLSGECDEVVCYYTAFRSIIRQEVVRETLLPVPLELENSEQAKGQIKYDPSPDVLLERVLPRYLRMLLLQAGLSSKASEHAARMRAMDSATRNADELTEKLRLFYNRARQTAITRELIDIVGGAEALK